MTTEIKTIKERLEILGIRPSKGLGQNFLINSRAYEKIVESGNIEGGENVLEIGPGLGTLTEYLTKTGAKIVAIEKDRKLISFLKSLFEKSDVTIVEGDVLKINPSELGLSKNNYKVIANIPYYITSRLLRNIFELWPKPKLIVLLVQHEVAQRIIAKPPHMNILAISVQYFSRPKIIGKIPKGSFYPSPEVDSSIIQLTPLIQTSDPDITKRFFKVVKIGFSSKRKKLINNLSAGLKLNKKDIENTMLSLEIDPGFRPENLTIEQWQKLAKKLG